MKPTRPNCPAAFLKPALLVLLALLSAPAFFGCAHHQKADCCAPAPVIAASATPTPTPTFEGDTLALFDGKTLAGWKETDFGGNGQVEIKDGQIILHMGTMTGVTWTNGAILPRANYEIQLEAMRVEGSDFFCGLTFPIGQEPCSLIIGGWGGGLVGLSSIDGDDAANNNTTRNMVFDNGRWYAIRLRVTPKKIEAWIDKDKVVDVDTEDKKFSVRFEVEPSIPLGIATYATTGALRNIRLKKL